MAYDRITLNNGLRIIGERMEAVHTVAVGVFVRTGAVNEAPAENGYSHFVEHMVFKGHKGQGRRGPGRRDGPPRRRDQRLHHQGEHLLLHQGPQGGPRPRHPPFAGPDSAPGVPRGGPGAGEGRRHRGDRHVRGQPGGPGPRAPVRRAVQGPSPGPADPRHGGDHPRHHPREALPLPADALHAREHRDLHRRRLRLAGGRGHAGKGLRRLARGRRPRAEHAPRARSKEPPRPRQGRRAGAALRGLSRLCRKRAGVLRAAHPLHALWRVHVLAPLPEHPRAQRPGLFGLQLRQRLLRRGPRWSSTPAPRPRPRSRSRT